jgi:hypothetical protein
MIEKKRWKKFTVQFGKNLSIGTRHQILQETGRGQTRKQEKAPVVLSW